jgi:glucosamine-6-phosphate deaminase
MDLSIHDTKAGLGQAAADAAAAAIGEAISANGRAVVVFATGASQFEMLDALAYREVDWSRVSGFHLDEYVGLPEEHPASFRRYLRERVCGRLKGLAKMEFIIGDAADPAREVERLNRLLAAETVDLCLAGIGENCHLAFNDPPADFEAEAPYLLVRLDEACRRQQLGEGWFPTLDAVPDLAISMSIRQIMKSRRVVLSVPDARKAEAVRNAVEGEVSPLYPASILQRHGNATAFLDRASSALLKGTGQLTP